MELLDVLETVWPVVKVVIYLIAPFVLCVVAAKGFLNYRNAVFFASQKYTVLEVNVPKEAVKTPLAMEVLLGLFYQTGGEANFWEKFLKGSTCPWFSLELAAIEGSVHFFIWTRSGFAKQIEQQVYAQYPGAVVNTVDDYAKQVKYDETKKMLVVEYSLAKKESVYPIKTYNDFNLQDEGVDDGVRVDPMNYVLEFLSQTKQGEQFWLQFVIRAHKANESDWSKRVWYKPSTWNKSKSSYEENAKKEIEKIKDESAKKIKDKEGKESTQVIPATKGQSDRIAAIERKQSKLAFDVGIRSIYIADKDKFNKGMFGSLMGLLRPFGLNDMNSFKPNNLLKQSYPWEDLFDVRTEQKRRDAFFAFQKRSFWYFPQVSNTTIMNVEELATVYHFPSMSITSPSVNKVMSKHAEPPGNLPI